MPVESQDDIIKVELGGDRPAIERLLAACAAADGVAPAFFLDAPAGGGVVTGFGVHAGGELIGFAHLPNDPEPEGSIAVLPAARRRGIGRRLLAAMRAEGRRRGLVEFILVNDAASPAGGAFLTAVGELPLFSEFRLAMDPGAVPSGSRSRPELVLAPAGAGDLETLIRIRAAAFADSIAETRSSILARLGETNRRYFLGVVDGEPVGMLRTGAWPDGADITSFGVLPAHQGRGFGRQMLLDAVALLRGEGWERITIEVDTTNERALGLYRACGFVPTARFDYARVAR